MNLETHRAAQIPRRRITPDLFQSATRPQWHLLERVRLYSATSRLQKASPPLCQVCQTAHTKKNKYLGHLIFLLHAPIRGIRAEAFSSYWSPLSNPNLLPRRLALNPSSAVGEWFFFSSEMIDSWIRQYDWQCPIWKGQPFLVVFFFSHPKYELLCGYLPSQCVCVVLEGLMKEQCSWFQFLFPSGLDQATIFL